MKQLSLLIVLTFLLSACGSGSGTGSVATPQSGTTTPDGFGFLLDSAVEGLRYSSGSHSGVTDANGKFGYINGENIAFYIGNTLIAYADTPKKQLTPYDFSNLSLFNTVDILRIFQSLDDDGNPNNGIQITEATHLLAETLPLKPTVSFNFPPDNIDPNIIFQLTRATSAGSRNVVPVIDAYLHFASTLDKLIDELQNDIQTLANQTRCSSGNQCLLITLETKLTSYCPPEGPSIIYSNINIDQAQMNALIANRKKLIDTKRAVELEADANDNSTGVCINQPYQPVLRCNTLSQCEVSI